MNDALRHRLTCALLAALWLASLKLLLPLGQDAVKELHAANPSEHVIPVVEPCDFVMFYAAGKMALSGAAASTYDLPRLFAQEQSNKAGGIMLQPWLYPPPGLLLPALFAGLPFLTAFVLWRLALLLAAVLVLRLAGLAWPVIAAAVFSPAALLNLSLGQLSLLASTILVAASFVADSRPGRAGLLFGALVIKPQIAILAPVIFAARRQWAGFAAAACVSLLICGLSLGLFGLPAWAAFLHIGLPISHQILILPFPTHPPPIRSSYEFYGISVLWMFRSFGFNLAVSQAAQALAAAGAMLGCYLLWRKPAENAVARVAVTACLALLVSPYGFLYDLCAPSIALAALAYQERNVRMSDVMLWSWPVIGQIITFHFYLQLAPLVLLLSCRRGYRSWKRPLF